MATYHERLSALAVSLQPANGGMTAADPAEFAATGAGHASGYTIVSTALTAAVDSSYAGMVVQCVGGTAANIGHMRRVTGFVNGTDTLTVNAFPAQVASGDRFRMWIPPSGWWSAATALTATVALRIYDARRTEAVDYWKGTAEEAGPYLWPIDAATLPSGTLPLVTSFSNGHVKTALWGASIAVGDLVEAVYFPEPMDDSRLEWSAEPIRRAGAMGAYGAPAAASGNRASSGTLAFALRGPGAARIGDHAEAHVLLRPTMDHVDPADFVTDAGSSGTSIEVASGTPVAGRMYVTEAGSALMCTAWASPTATVSPAPTTDPPTGETVYGITTYTSSLGANLALTVHQWLGDGILETHHGIIPAISLNMVRGEWPHLALNCQGVDGYRAWKGPTNAAITRAFRSKLSTMPPFRLTDVRMVLGTTTLDVVSASIDFGQAVVQKGGLRNANELAAWEVVNDQPTGSIVAVVDATSLAQLDRFISGEQITLLVQSGAAPGYPGIFAFYAYKARYTGATMEPAEGLAQITLPFEVVTDPTEQTLPRWAFGIG